MALGVFARGSVASRNGGVERGLLTGEGGFSSSLPVIHAVLIFCEFNLSALVLPSEIKIFIIIEAIVRFDSHLVT